VTVDVQIWQITPVGGIYLLLISPIVHRLLICYGYDFDCTPSIPYHIEQIMWFATSAFFFTAEFPQSLLSPGSCDHFFHGHQVNCYCNDYVHVVTERQIWCRSILFHFSVVKCKIAKIAVVTRTMVTDLFIYLFIM